MTQQAIPAAGKPPHKVFTDHYPALCKLLSSSSKELLPHFVASSIISISDHEEITAKENPMDKAVLMLRSVSSGVECGHFKSFHKMLHVMHIYGNNDVQDLSLTISKLIPNDLVATPTQVEVQEKFPSIEVASMHFSAVVIDIAEILEKTIKNNIDKFKCFCSNLTIAGQHQNFFSQKEIEAIKECTSFYQLFSEVNRLWRWDSHRLLEMIIDRADSEEATAKLRQFQRKVDNQTKLKSLAKMCELGNEQPPQGYTSMVAIIDKDYAKITLDEFQSVESFLSIHFGDMPPVKRIKLSSVKLIWHIPAAVVPSLLKKAYLARESLLLMPILYIQIAEVIIWDKQWGLSPQELKTREAEMTKLRQDITGLTETVTQREAHLKTVQDDLVKATNETKELQDNFEKVKEEAEAVPKLTSQNEELSAKLTQMENDKNSLSEQLTETQTKLEGESAQLSEAQETIKVARSKQNEIVRELDAKHSEISDITCKAREQVDKMRQDLDTVTDERNKLDNDNSELKKQNADMKVTEKNLGEEITVMKAELVKLQQVAAQEPVGKQPDSLPVEQPERITPQGSIIQMLRKEKKSLQSTIEVITKERDQALEQLKLLQQPKEAGGSALSTQKRDTSRDSGFVSIPNKDFGSIAEEDGEKKA